MLKSIDSLTVTIAANGFADGPAQALREYLLRAGAARVIYVAHPLEPEDGSHHLVAVTDGDGSERTRRIWLPSRPPWTFPLDLLVPPLAPRSDIWFGFNGLACARGLVERALGRAQSVVYWCVDYVDQRFGEGLRTKSFELVDGLCCRRADLRVELTEEARDARTRRHGDAGLAPSEVVPMGAWIDRVPVATEESRRTNRLVYLGHLVERQGVESVIRAVEGLRRTGVDATASIVGRGPLRDQLSDLAAQTGVGDVVEFHGFVEDHREVERVLAGSAVALAPYVESDASFTRFADPGKIKAYLAAGLPIVTTRVAPIADELERTGAATIASDSTDEITSAVRELVTSAELWGKRHTAALALAQEYDWSRLLPRVFESLEIAS